MAVDSILKAHPKTDLAVFVVWSPILPADDRQAAEKLAAELNEPRAQFYWDSTKAVGKSLEPILDIGDSRFAWDVYCLFGSDAVWGESPPAAAKWAHQLGGADRKHYFGKRLGETLRGWTTELAGGPSHRAKPAAEPTSVIEVAAKDLKPITEVLLDKILDDMRQRRDGADAKVFSEIAAELRRRMAQATKPHASKIPKALRLGNDVLVVTSNDCSSPDQPTTEESGKR